MRCQLKVCSPPVARETRKKFKLSTLFVLNVIQFNSRLPTPNVDENSPIENPDVPSSSTEAGVKIDLELPRRTRLVSFTCNLCGKPLIGVFFDALSGAC